MFVNLIFSFYVECRETATATQTHRRDKTQWMLRAAVPDIMPIGHALLARGDEFRVVALVTIVERSSTVTPKGRADNYCAASCTASVPCGNVKKFNPKKPVSLFTDLNKNF
jgi:hypothetical protein